MQTIDYKRLSASVQMNEDWVFIKKAQDLDGAKKVGLIIVPEDVNTNIRESKIGKIMAAGAGHYGIGGWIESNVETGRYCYYTRYGKEQFEDTEGQVWVFTRGRGVLAYVDVESKKVFPRFDRLLVKLDEEETYSIISRVTPTNRGEEYKRYRRYRVLEIGPGELSKPVTVTVGDYVWAAEANGVKVSWVEDNKIADYRLIPESECIAYEKRG